MSDSDSSTPAREWKTASGLTLTRVPSILDEVRDASKRGELWGDAKELCNRLHFLPTSNNSKVQELLITQYKIAKQLRNNAWTKKLRANALVHQSDRWVYENLDGADPSRRRRAPISTRAAQETLVAPTDYRQNVAKTIVVEGEEFPPLPVTEVPNKSAVFSGVESDNSLDLAAEIKALESDEEDMGDDFPDLSDFLVVDEVGAESPPPCKRRKEESPVRTQEFVGARFKSSGETRPRQSTSVQPRRSSGVDTPRSRIGAGGSKRRYSSDRPTMMSRVSTNHSVRERKHQKKKCILRDCSITDRNLKRHSLTHLPRRFRTDAWADSAFHDARVEGVHWLCRRVTNSDDLSSLMAWIRNLPEFPDNAIIVHQEGQNMEEVCRREGWIVPFHFSFYPINSPAVLFHWRIICTILDRLSQQERLEFFQLDRRSPTAGVEEKVVEKAKVVEKEKVVEKAKVVEKERAVEKARVVEKAKVVEKEKVVEKKLEERLVVVASASGREATVEKSATASTCSAVSSSKVASSKMCLAMDSHFHLDRSRRSLAALSPWSTVEDLLVADVGIGPDRRVQVIGGVVVWCDPDTFPQVLPTLPDGFGSAVGFHPKSASKFNEKSFRHMKRLYMDLDCVALGEIGLDYSAPRHTWIVQESMLKEILRFAMISRPVVFHVREGSHTSEHENANNRLIKIAKGILSPQQPIHLHCYTGGSEESFAWLQAFPNCMFGFTALTKSFDCRQKQALRALKLDVLLLETDSPHLAPISRRQNTPSFIGDVAEIVAGVRDESAEEILAAAARNCKRLYDL